MYRNTGGNSMNMSFDHNSGGLDDGNDMRQMNMGGRRMNDPN